MALGNNQFHTYAIEVTRSHISWFVDTKVIRTEKRSQARTGAAYNMRFRLQATRGAKAWQKALAPLSPREREMFVATLRAYEDELMD